MVRVTVAPMLNTNVRCTLDGEDVTAAILGQDGVACLGKARLWPQGMRELRISILATAAPADLRVELFAHPTAVASGQVRQTMDFRLPPAASAVLSSHRAAPPGPGAG